MRRLIAYLFLALIGFVGVAQARPATLTYRDYTAAIIQQEPIRLAQLGGGLMFPGPGTPHAAAGYQGPGDVAGSSAYVVYSCARAYTAAKAAAGAKACNICEPTNVTCVDVTFASNGFVPAAQFTVGGTNCLLISTCTIQTWYDQIGTQCSGSCDELQSSPSSRATLTPSALGGLPCGTGLASNSVGYIKTSLTTITAPYVVSAVVKLNSGISSQAFYFGDNGNAGFGYNIGSTAFFGFFASSNVTGPADDNNFHAVQMISAAASGSAVFVDSSSVTGQTGGGASLGTSVRLWTDAFANRFTGTVCEIAVYNNASFSPSAVNSNQHSATNGYNF